MSKGFSYEIAVPKMVKKHVGSMIDRIRLHRDYGRIKEVLAENIKEPQVFIGMRGMHQVVLRIPYVSSYFVKNKADMFVYTNQQLGSLSVLDTAANMGMPLGTASTPDAVPLIVAYGLIAGQVSSIDPRRIAALANIKYNHLAMAYEEYLDYLNSRVTYAEEGEGDRIVEDEYYAMGYYGKLFDAMVTRVHAMNRTGGGITFEDAERAIMNMWRKHDPSGNA